MVDWFVENLSSRMAARGHPPIPQDTGQANADEQRGIVLHPVDSATPRPYRRRSRAIFVAGVAEATRAPNAILETAYPLLVRSLSNILILVVHDAHTRASLQAHFVTPERGYYALPYTGDDETFFAAVWERLAPLATSHLVIENEFHPDLPKELWDGDDCTEAIYRAGLRLKAWDLLPAPVSIHTLLSEHDLRHVQRLFGIGGLSYGNISARLDKQRFWMSASGVDKSRLRVVGEDVLLVTGYNPRTQAMVLSVPPHRRPRRVSVDAIEHHIIYQEHPGVGAIIHVHAWMDGIASTAINYPCGTLELAQAVADLVRDAPDPNRAVIGLKNHGLTITGPDLDEILARIDGRIMRDVPMH